MKLLRRLQGLVHMIPSSVAFDEHGVVRTMKNGETESVAWSHLETVSVLTTDGGPWAEDVFWLLEGSVGGCAVPQAVAGAQDLLAKLQELPGFDNEAFIKAMGSTSHATFVCWKRAR